MRDCQDEGGFCSFVEKFNTKYSGNSITNLKMAMDKTFKEVFKHKVDNQNNNSSAMETFFFHLKPQQVRSDIRLSHLEEDNFNRLNETKNNLQQWYSSIDNYLKEFSNRTHQEDVRNCTSTKYIQHEIYDEETQSSKYFKMSFAKFLKLIKDGKVLSSSSIFSSWLKHPVQMVNVKDQKEVMLNLGLNEIFNDLVKFLSQLTEDVEDATCGYSKSLEWVSYALKVHAHGDDISLVNGHYLGQFVEDSCSRPTAFFHCSCLCHKKMKLQIYTAYKNLWVLENLDLSNLGSLITFAQNEAKLEILSAENFTSLDRDILADIIGSRMGIGLIDFVSQLSQPSKVFNSKYEFPSMVTWNEKERQEVQHFFNFPTDPTFAGSGRLLIDGQTMPSRSLQADFCSVQNRKVYNLTEYCKMSQAMPSIDKVMPLMRLAAHPAKRFTNVGHFQLSQFRQKPAAFMPNITFIPLCMYGETALNYWHNSNIRKEKKRDMNIDEMKQDLYQYPLCNLFENRPTDLGMCSTFNGMGLR